MLQPKFPFCSEVNMAVLQAWALGGSERTRCPNVTTNCTQNGVKKRVEWSHTHGAIERSWKGLLIALVRRYGTLNSDWVPLVSLAQRLHTVTNHHASSALRARRHVRFRRLSEMPYFDVIKRTKMAALQCPVPSRLTCERTSLRFVIRVSEPFSRPAQRNS